MNEILWPIPSIVALCAFALLASWFVVEKVRTGRLNIKLLWALTGVTILNIGFLFGNGNRHLAAPFIFITGFLLSILFSNLPGKTKEVKGE